MTSAPPRLSPRAWATMALTEGKLVARDTAGLIVPIGLPMLIMAMNGLNRGHEPVAAFGGLPAFDGYVVPMTLVMIAALIGVVNMPSFLATYRKTGVLRRLSVTPAHPAMVLVAQVVVSVAQAILGLVLALGLAVVAFDLQLPRGPWAAVGVFVLVMAAMYALGMVVASISPSTNAAIAIGLVLFFAMMAGGGGFGAPGNLPDWLRTAGELLPYGAGTQAMSAAWSGAAPEWGHLAVLLGFAVVGSGISAKLFRWS